MGALLRVLIVEDSPEDAELLLWELEKGGYDVRSERVETAANMAMALDRADWDLVLADHSMPEFSGEAALQLLRERGHELPLIFVSGTLGEEAAIAALKTGANDYIMKGKLQRLLPAIERELREADGRRERRRAEAALRDSEARYRLLFESNPLPTLVCDLETLRIANANGAAVEKYGYSRDQLLARAIGDLHFPEDVPALREQLSVTSAVMGLPRTWRQRTKDGTMLEVELICHSLSFADRPAILILVNDITERRQLELRLRQAQKLEAIGGLAGGVAHDFNNLLTAILGFSEIVLEGLDPNDPRSVNVQEIRSAAERGAGVTQQLLAFSRKQRLDERVLDLGGVVRDLARLLERLIGEHIALESVIHPDAGQVKADRNQLEAVIMNLAVNARDAMPNGGRLAIEVASAELDPSYVGRDPDVVPGSYVLLTVSDTGVGMDEATKSRIFEPFFTTKEQGRGTGLGLATAYGIIKQSRGYIWVDSEPGRGSTFRIYLPRTFEDEEALRPKPKDVARTPAAETIVLVEDDEGVRRLARMLLAKSGYRVLEAESGERALQILETFAEPVHLLVTDVVMGGIPGPELAARLVRSRPDLKVIYMSGYTDDEVVRRGPPRRDDGFLQKPFTADTLRRKVREVLDRPGV